MGGQLLHNEVDLPVIQAPVHLLPEEQIVEHGLVAPLVCDDFLPLYVGLIGGGGDVLVGAELLVECLICLPADLGPGIVLVLVLVEGIAQGVLPAVRLEGGEFHIRQLGHVVDLVGRVNDRAEGRQHPLGFRLELVGLLPQQILQIGLVGPSLGSGLAQQVLVLGDQLAVNEAQAAVDLGVQAGKRRVPLLEDRIAVIYGGRQAAVGSRQNPKLVQRTVLVQARLDRLRCGQLPFVFLLDFVRHPADALHVRLPLLLAVIDRAQVPGQLHGHVLSLHQFHRFSLLFT